MEEVGVGATVSHPIMATYSKKMAIVVVVVAAAVAVMKGVFLSERRLFHWYDCPWMAAVENAGSALLRT